MFQTPKEDDQILQVSGEDIDKVNELFVGRQSNRFEFFHQLNKSKMKDPSQQFRKVVQDAMKEEQVNIMLSDEEMEKRQKVQQDMRVVKMLMTATFKSKKYVKKIRCCGKLCYLGRRHPQIKIQKQDNQQKIQSKQTWREVIRKKDDTEELEYQKLFQKGIIKQDHPVRKKWDIMIILFSLYNCIELPMEIAFNWRMLHDTYNITENLNHVIDFMFFMDIVSNFRTTYFHPKTGEEIIQKNQISNNYLRGQFFIDLLSTIPFDVIYSIFFQQQQDSANSLQIMSVMKIIRILRLSRLITYLNQAEDVKLSLRLMQTIFLIVLYIHITGCFWFLIVKQDYEWEPDQDLDLEFKEYDFGMKFCISIYTSILAICGQDILPVTLFQYFFCSPLIVFGAILQATMFGQVASIIQSMSRKSQQFQQKIDLANTSMKNMQLNEIMQQKVRDFMTKTMSYMDNQKELEQFLKILSPSVRVRVTNYIFEQAILKNQIFCDKLDVVEYIIEYVQPRLFFPEDQIIRMGSYGNHIYFIAYGNCMVSVINHLKQDKSIQRLCQGDYFGEIAVILGSVRSSNIESINYSTLAYISGECLQKLCNMSPEIYTNLKQCALKDYNDDWIQFKIVLLKQIDYFNVNLVKQDNPYFFKEIQFYMEESVFQPGSTIVEIGQVCKAVIFIVNGTVDIEVEDADMNTYLLDTLKQGDMFGQYSVLFGQELEFKVIAKSHVRILKLSEHFFSHFINQTDCCEQFIDGFSQAIDRAQKHVDEFDIPVCDYKLFDYDDLDLEIDQKKKKNFNESFQRAVKRAVIIAKLRRPKQNYMILDALKQLKEMRNLKNQLTKMSTFKEDLNPELVQLQDNIESQIRRRIDKNNMRVTKIDRIQKQKSEDNSFQKSKGSSSFKQMIKQDLQSSRKSKTRISIHHHHSLKRNSNNSKDCIISNGNHVSKSNEKSKQHTSIFRNQIMKTKKWQTQQNKDEQTSSQDVFRNQFLKPVQRHTSNDCSDEYQSSKDQFGFSVLKKKNSPQIKTSNLDQLHIPFDNNQYQKSSSRQSSSSNLKINIQSRQNQNQNLNLQNLSPQKNKFKRYSSRDDCVDLSSPFNESVNSPQFNDKNLPLQRHLSLRRHVSMSKPQSMKRKSIKNFRNKNQRNLNSYQYLRRQYLIKKELTKNVVGGVFNVIKDAEQTNVVNFLSNKHDLPSVEQQNVLNQMRKDQIIEMMKTALQVLVRKRKKVINIQRRRSQFDQLNLQNRLKDLDLSRELAFLRGDSGIKDATDKNSLELINKQKQILMSQKTMKIQRHILPLIQEEEAHLESKKKSSDASNFSSVSVEEKSNDSSNF